LGGLNGPHCRSERAAHGAHRSLLLVIADTASDMAKSTCLTLSVLITHRFACNARSQIPVRNSGLFGWLSPAATEVQVADLKRLFLGKRFDQLDDGSAEVSVFNPGERLRDRDAFLGRQELVSKALPLAFRLTPETPLKKSFGVS
jgi:hypothetical protein